MHGNEEAGLGQIRNFKIVKLEADTICVHGDTQGSDALAAQIRAGLERAGITVKAIGVT